MKYDFPTGPDLFHSLVVAAMIGAILLASGCDKYTDSGQTVGQKLDNAIDKTNAKIVAAGEKIEKKVDQAGATVAGVGESISTNTGAAVNKAGNAVNKAGDAVFSKVEQVGTPSELYETPNSLFVAGFIGSPKMNFLEGAHAAKHDCATIGIRSEHIEIVPEGQGMWSGKVIHTEDLGSDNYLFVDLGGAEPVIVRQSGKVTVSLGTTLNLNPAAGRLFRFNEAGLPI